MRFWVEFLILFDFKLIFSPTRCGRRSGGGIGFRGFRTFGMYRPVINNYNKNMVKNIK